MKTNRIYLENEPAHYFSTNLQESSQSIHFYPGNGLPAGVYRSFLGNLAEKFNVTSLVYRASWKNAIAQDNQVNWEVYADDLIKFLDQTQSKPIIGVGHSQGASATIIAASKRPDLFSKLVLFEPVSFTKFREQFIRLIPYFLKKKMDPYKSALKKKSIWNSTEEYLEYLKENKAYRRLPIDDLKIFAEESLKLSEEDKFKLLFPLDWEVANYGFPPNLDKYIKKLSVPYKVILGKPSFFTNDTVRKKWKSIAGIDLVINNDYGHLIPLEAPEFCADQIS